VAHWAYTVGQRDLAVGLDVTAQIAPTPNVILFAPCARAAARGEHRRVSESLAITRPATLENLRSLREFVLDACLACGGDADTCDLVELAVDEACTNIVLHGYKGRPTGDITLQFACDEGMAEISLLDQGQPFSPKDAPPPDLEAGWQERRIGGLGVYLIRETMDEVEYTSDGSGGNRLTLRKRLRPTRATQDNA
jgi:serine/threonine-protein kinase RsbW